MKESYALILSTYVFKQCKDKSMYLLQAQMGTLQDSD